MRNRKESQGNRERKLRVKAEKRGGSRRREDRWGGRKEGEEAHSYGVSCIYIYIYPGNSPERKELLPLFYRFGD